MSRREVSKRKIPGILHAAGGATALAAYLVALIVYLNYPGFTEHLEPAIASIAAGFARGLQVYPLDPNTPPFGMQYGPLTYAIPALGIRLSGDAIVAPKVAAALASGLGVAFAAIALLKRGPWRPALALAGMMALWLLCFAQESYMVRPDPYLLLSVGAALFAIEMKSTRIASLLVGILMGLAMDFKIHAALPFLPLLGLLWHRSGFRGVIFPGLIAASLFLLPFALPNVSLEGFTKALLLATRHGLRGELFLETVLMGLLMAAPAAFLFMRNRDAASAEIRKYRAFYATLAGSLLLTLAIASKNGAGSNHLIPFAPLLACAALRLSCPDEVSSPVRKAGSWVPVGVTLFYLAVLLSAAVYGQNEVWYIFNRRKNDLQLAREDLREVIAALPGRRITMGIGSASIYAATWVRPDLVHAGHPYLLEPVAAMDLQAAGEEIRAEEILDPSATDVWLIPRGDPPFSMRNFYRTGPIFSDALREYFLKHWQITGHSRAYEIWTPVPRASRDSTDPPGNN